VSREALTKNVAPVSELITLCRGMKHLKSLVHVSSAYSQCNRTGVIDEVHYQTPLPPSKLLGLLDWMTDEQLETLAPTLSSGYPNIYTFTKALAEQVIMDEARGLPVAIYRPSIIGASLNEPVEGWVDVLHGPTGAFIAVGKGFLRVVRCDEFRKADFVPVDLVNNFLIAIGWITGTSPSPSPIFYNYSSSTLNPMSWIQLCDYFMEAQELYPMDKVYRRPWVCKARPAQFYPVFNFFLHLIPGFIGDTILRLLQKKPFFVRTYSKLNGALQQLDYFLQMDWRWTHNNSDKLLALMSPEDRQTFDFDIRKMNWQTYIKRYCLGVKQYLLHEDLADLPKARQNIKRLRNMRFTFNLIVFLLATRVLYRRSQVARQLWNGMWDFCVRGFSKLGIPAWHSF
jgi:fatty acyl-CoA reductase